MCAVATCHQRPPLVLPTTSPTAPPPTACRHSGHLRHLSLDDGEPKLSADTHPAAVSRAAAAAPCTPPTRRRRHPRTGQHAAGHPSADGAAGCGGWGPAAAAPPSGHAAGACRGAAPPHGVHCIAALPASRPTGESLRQAGSAARRQPPSASAHPPPGCSCPAPQRRWCAPAAGRRCFRGWRPAWWAPPSPRASTSTCETTSCAVARPVPPCLPPQLRCHPATLECLCISRARGLAVAPAARCTPGAQPRPAPRPPGRPPPPRRYSLLRRLAVLRRVAAEAAAGGGGRVLAEADIRGAGVTVAESLAVAALAGMGNVLLTKCGWAACAACGVCGGRHMPAGGLPWPRRRRARPGRVAGAGGACRLRRGGAACLLVSSPRLPPPPLCLPPPPCSPIWMVATRMQAQGRAQAAAAGEGEVQVAPSKPGIVAGGAQPPPPPPLETPSASISLSASPPRPCPLHPPLRVSLAPTVPRPPVVPQSPARCTPSTACPASGMVPPPAW